MSKVDVFITVDTEHSIGGAFRNPALKPVGNEKRIYGKIGGRYYGIPLIMDIADRCGIPVTFFVEVLNHYYFGKDETRQVCRYILERGHDVQLHLHPNYLNFTQQYPEELVFKDNMSAYDAARQTELIQEGKRLLQEYGVKDPVAFRAGNYGADQNTIGALSKSGFVFDSSYNLAFPRKSGPLFAQPLNDLARIEDIFELPVTCFQEGIGSFKKRVPMDINGAGFRQMRDTLRFASKNNFRCVTFILHSFSFLHSKDPQYCSVKIRKNIITRFQKLCAFLADNTADYNSTCFSDYKKKPLVSENPELIPNISLFSTIDHYREKIWSKLRYEQ